MIDTASRPPAPPGYFYDTNGALVSLSAAADFVINSVERDLAEANQRREQAANARAAAAEAPAREEDDPEWPDVQQARYLLLNSERWDAMGYTDRLALCRQARCSPHLPDVMRFEMVKEMFPHGMLIEGSPEWKRYRTLAAAKSRALKTLGEKGTPGRKAWDEHYTKLSQLRERYGWTPAGDKAIEEVELPDRQAREDQIEQHVAAGTLRVDPSPGDRSPEAVKLRKMIREDNDEIKRRRAALKVDPAIARADDKAVAHMERIVGMNPTEDAASVADAVRRERCASRYAKPYALRCTEDLETMVKLKRPIPLASNHPCGPQLRWRCARFAHSDRGRI